MPAKVVATATLVRRAVELIEKKIFMVREQKVMLDSDLAALYGVSTARLNEQVNDAGTVKRQAL